MKIFRRFVLCFCFCLLSLTKAYSLEILLTEPIYPKLYLPDFKHRNIIVCKENWSASLNQIFKWASILPEQIQCEKQEPLCQSFSQSLIFLFRDQRLRVFDCSTRKELINEKLGTKDEELLPLFYPAMIPTPMKIEEDISATELAEYAILLKSGTFAEKQTWLENKKKQWEEILFSNPSANSRKYTEILFHLGLLYESKNKFAQARPFYELFLKHAPDAKKGIEALLRLQRKEKIQKEIEKLIQTSEKSLLQN